MLTTAFLITVVVAVVVPVTHLAERYAVSVVTPEVSGRAGGCWSPAQMIQLVRFIPAVVVPITDEILRDAAAVLTGELMLLARLIGAALFITAVSTIITTVTPNRHNTHSRELGEKLLFFTGINHQNKVLYKHCKLIYYFIYSFMNI